MNDDSFKSFFNEHKQSIADDGFSQKLLNQLSCMPEPAPKDKKNGLIVGGFTLAGLLTFLLLGGYGVLLQGLSNVGSVFVSFRNITPEIIVAIMSMILAFSALIRYAVRDE